jgi:ABC-type nitrate/sulfonate/bicarbonate transport system permease component
MAQTGVLTRQATRSAASSQVTVLRIVIILALLAAWELLARSGLLFEDVVPPLVRIVQAMIQLLSSSIFYQNLWVTALEVFFALTIGGTAGIVVGIAVGGSAFMTRAYEAYLYY